MSKADRNTWVWVTKPDEDTLDALRPGRTGWWTCHEDTRRGDLALVYRSLPDAEIGHLVEAASKSDIYKPPPDDRGPGLVATSASTSRGSLSRCSVAD